jgi:predicted signal transduction protein with EAL and GGDEF domain
MVDGCLLMVGLLFGVGCTYAYITWFIIRLVQPEPQMATSGKFYLALRLPASEADEQAG